MIKSNKSETEIRLVIDQKTYLEDNNDNVLTKYLNENNDRKKVLVISQDKKIIDNMKKYFHNENIALSNFLYGKDAIDRIKSGRKYDYVFIADSMNKMNGIETLKELRKLKDFSSLVIVMINKNNEGLGKHYIEDGFDDYLIVDNMVEDLNRILKL